ncbi:DoxX family protein [Microlunatus parietis]|uniref:Putative oxidoreductase n=1 Tax=Microlunatus parietis TaxID=682979 RepID=A0A7Y9I9C6_9ACTN|nr:DoxX family protein [Microlunatus parietis]NYE72731.1 putative oxidoreductase [Microlunatus parietis]
MAKTLQVLRDIVLLITRIGLGAILIVHGWRRWQVVGPQSQIDYLAQFSTPYPQVVVWGTIILELVGGLFLIVGALTPLVAAAVLAQQVLIICYTNWYGYQFLAANVPEFSVSERMMNNLTLGLLALIFLVFGAGRASIDRLFRREKVEEPEQQQQQYDYDDTQPLG